MNLEKPIKILLGMYRKEWYEFQQEMEGSIVRCSCFQMLHSVENLRNHWQMGHFDTPVYKEIKDEEAK